MNFTNYIYNNMFDLWLKQVMIFLTYLTYIYIYIYIYKKKIKDILFYCISNPLH